MCLYLDRSSNHGHWTKLNPKKKKAHVFEMEKLHCESDQQVAFRQLTRENEKEKRPVDYPKKKKKDFDQ